MPKNKDLHKAMKAKKDEFYTQLADIENELRYYKDYFKGKTVLCNCDDPFESNFFKYFALNFNRLGLKKLITTSYIGSPIADTELSLYDDDACDEGKTTRDSHKIEITEVIDANNDGAIDLVDVAALLKSKHNKLIRLDSDGDFRCEDCVELLREADIVVTNPPFSLFSEYLSLLIMYRKKFIIMGNLNAVTYKGTLRHIIDNKIWFGASIHSGDREFGVPCEYPLNTTGSRIDENGKKFIRVKGVRWYTNLDYAQRHENLVLYKKYNETDYPKYDNYSAINVDKTADIPEDYYGPMGVPITFMDKYNPEQFEILGSLGTYAPDGYSKCTAIYIKGEAIYKRFLIKRKV